MPTLTDSQIAGYLRAAGFPADQIATGVAIALAESGGRTDALNTANRNGSWDAGLMQVNSIHGYSQSYLFDPKNNVAASIKIYRAAGNRWTPWSTFNSGSFRRFLPRGNAVAGSAIPPAENTGVPKSTPRTLEDKPNTLVSGEFWTKVGLFLMGGILIFMGLYRLTGVGGTIVKTAKGILPA